MYHLLTNKHFPCLFFLKWNYSWNTNPRSPWSYGIGMVFFVSIFSVIYIFLFVFSVLLPASWFNFYKRAFHNVCTDHNIQTSSHMILPSLLENIITSFHLILVVISWWYFCHQSCSYWVLQNFHFMHFVLWIPVYVVE